MDRNKKLINQPFIHILLVLVLGVLVYSNTFSVPFVFDDGPSIVDNPEIRDTSRSLAAIAGYEFNARRAFGYFTFALNYHFGGLDVTGYHAVNLAIHIFVAMLVYALVRLTFRTPHLRESRIAPKADTVALLSSLLFIVHPVQTQAVTYVVQRLTSLATLFYLLSVVLYAVGRLRIEDGGRETEGGEGSNWRRGLPWLAGAVLSAVLAMKTKEFSFTLPFAVALYEFSFFRGGWGRRLLYLLPLLLTLPIVPVSVLTAGESAGELLSDVSQQVRMQTDIAQLHYLFTQLRVIVTYLRLLVLPIHQNLDYDYPIYTTFFTPAVFLSFVLLASIFLLALYLYAITAKVPGTRSSPSLIAHLSSRGADPSARVIGFGLLWFFLALSVESSFIPILDIIFEHRVYLPSIGVFAAAAAAFVLACDVVHIRARGKVAAVVVALIVLGLGAGTYKRNVVWGDAVSLWEDVSVKSPSKTRGYINLGAALGEAGQMEEAVAALSKAIQLGSDNPEPYISLGAVLGEAGRTDEAMKALSRAIRIRPDKLEAYVNLGAALASAGRREEAIRVLSEAVRFEPDNADALNNLGIVLTDAGRLEEAITTLTKAVTVQPENARAHFNLGRAYLLAGRHVEAVAPLEAAIRLKPDYDNAFITLAAALNRSGRFREAAALMDRNLGRLAGRADARFARGVAAHGEGDSATASRQLEALWRLDRQIAEQLAAFMSRSSPGIQEREAE